MADIASHVISVPLIADLKLQPGNSNNTVLTTGALTVGDGAGKFYYFDKNDNTTPEDMVNYNTITPVGGGRYKAVFTRMIGLPHGTLSIQSGVKQFFYSGVTAADGTCAVNLTVDNTPTGAPIFTDVLFDDSKATVNASTANDAISSCRKSLSADKKVLTHLFFRGNNQNFGIGIAVTVNGFRSAPSNIPVSFLITGK